MAAEESVSSASKVPLVSLSTCIGSAITVAWLIFMAWMIARDWGRALSLTLNEWGDVFAGFFAPLAFLWLVLGFIQQGTELRLSSDALNLQAKELNDSVKQQQEMVRLAQQSYDAEVEMNLQRRAADAASFEPLFVFTQLDTAIHSLTGGLRVPLSISNHGGTVTSLRFDSDVVLPEPIDEIAGLARGAEHDFYLTVPDGLNGLNLTISYLDAKGRSSMSKFMIEVQQKPRFRLRFIRSAIPVCL